jgi:hypothetical protein
MVDQLESMSQTRTPAPFSLEGELAKIKIPIPLNRVDDAEAVIVHRY